MKKDITFAFLWFAAIFECLSRHLVTDLAKEGGGESRFQILPRHFQSKVDKGLLLRIMVYLYDYMYS